MLKESITGLQFSQQGPTIHHLLFADDSLFVCKATKEEVTALQLILKSYGVATGQSINLNKSSLTFGNLVEDDIKGELKEITGIFSEGGAGVYLGLLEYLSGSKIELLSFIHERMKSRMSGWFARILSQGGKEILLKSVARHFLFILCLALDFQKLLVLS